MKIKTLNVHYQDRKIKEIGGQGVFYKGTQCLDFIKNKIKRKIKLFKIQILKQPKLKNET